MKKIKSGEGATDFGSLHNEDDWPPGIDMSEETVEGYIKARDEIDVPVLDVKPRKDQIADIIYGEYVKDAVNRGNYLAIGFVPDWVDRAAWAITSLE